MNSMNRMIASVAFGLFVLVGTYNSVVINSESHISGTDVKFVKRLDELYGVTVPGREVAASVTWKKLAPSPLLAKQPGIINQKISTVASAPAQETPVAPETVAAVQEELTLSLVEVINPKKWLNGLPASQFNGSLSTNQGVIENLSVSLPNGEGVSVSFSEMTGNVFEYDLDGELYSGMMYLVDQNAYMVTLTNGPLEGTRLRFSNMQPVEEQQQNEQTLAENNVDVGSFGNEQNSEQVNPENVEQINQNDQQMQMEAMQAQAHNPDNSLPM
jgi:hypothetical protein